ncbi:MAG: sugar phosphate isomerase/epimerase [Methylobacteriaceae bacterium]|nr:sugar phosphate isomerase/epimerase [Methylobacteriaceae bacterium]
MQIGFSLLVVCGHVTPTHYPLLDSLKRLGYDGAEIPIFEGDVPYYAELGRVLRDKGLKANIATIVTEDANPLSPDKSVRDKARDRLRHALDCGHAMGAELMCGPYHSPLGVFSGGGPTDDELSRLADVLRDAAQHGEEAGVHLSIEALNRFECYVLNTMDQLSQLRRRVAHQNFSFMYDTFHANIEEKDPVAAFERHAHELTHIHISENDRGVPGRGHVLWAATFKAIRASGYDRWLTVEAFGRAVPALAAATRVWRDLFPDIETLFAESIKMIRRHWAEAA